MVGWRSVECGAMKYYDAKLIWMMKKWMNYEVAVARELLNIVAVIDENESCLPLWCPLASLFPLVPSRYENLQRVKSVREELKWHDTPSSCDGKLFSLPSVFLLFKKFPFNTHPAAVDKAIDLSGVILYTQTKLRSCRSFLAKCFHLKFILLIVVAFLSFQVKG